MHSSLSLKHFLGALFLSIILLSIHEWYYRTQEYFEPGYDDNVDLWAHWRGKVDEASSEDVVIVGSSRIHFNTNLNIWDSITGNRPIMLAAPGTSPFHVVDDLIENTDFNGLMVVGVSTGLFFTVKDSWGARAMKDEDIKHFYNQTYAQRFSQWVYEFIDPHFAYLEPERRLSNLFTFLPFKDRDSIYHEPKWPFMVYYDHSRSARMIPEMETDTAQQNKQKRIWTRFGMGNRYADSIEVIFDHYIPLFEKFQDRGGRIAFVSSPVTEFYYENDSIYFPKEKYWDRLLRESGAKGYHYEDYPETRDMVPPEWSHLNRRDSDIFTRKLIELLKEDELL